MFTPITFNEDVCDGCNVCVEVCPMDVLAPNPEKGKPPLVAFPDECSYDGACWIHCPHHEERAIRIITPLPMRVSVLRGDRSTQKANGEKA